MARSITRAAARPSPIALIRLRVALACSVFPLACGSRSFDPAPPAPPPEWASRTPGYDAFEATARVRGIPLPPEASSDRFVEPGTTVHREDRLGVPTFIWAARGGAAAGGAGGSPERAARAHLAAYAPLYRLGAEDVEAARVAGVHDTGSGAVIVKFRQHVGGIEVFREELAVAMRRDHGLIALSGYLTATAGAATAGLASTLRADAREAVAAALLDMTGERVDPAALREIGAPGDEHRLYATAGRLGSPFAPDGLVLTRPARVKPVFFHRQDGLVPAHYVEIEVGATGEHSSAMRAYVVSASDRTLLFRNDLTADEAYSYRVWADATGLRAPQDGPQGSGGTPHPTGLTDGFQAPFVPPALVTLESGPILRRDPWLPPGSTETVGNNADVYADIVTPNGRGQGDLRARVTSPGVFDRVFDPGAHPGADLEQRAAAVTQLFYDVNFLHDWFYDVGFDEAAGNAQQSNYGRGGREGDPLLAEAQDFGGFNNANMSTPSDGASPRMQMYVFTGLPGPTLTVETPAGIAATYNAGVSGSLGLHDFRIAAEIVPVADEMAPHGDGCQPISADLTGKIAFTDRGACQAVDKARQAQAAGAVGLIVANLASSPNPGSAPSITGTGPDVTLGVISVNAADGDRLRGQFAMGVTVRGTMERKASIDRDGTLDAQIVSHEWGHYISARLVGNGNGLANRMGGGLGEGWGDFHALLITVRAEDSLVESNQGWAGVYAIAGYTRSGGGTNNNGYYFGVRRVPYSTDFAKNPLTFRHIGNGIPLPAGPPYLFGADGRNNAEVHNAGTIWATMLWECYAALLRDTLGVRPRLAFTEAQDRMRGYLVAAYKLTPVTPTLLEARDALLAAAYAKDTDDFALFWRAFARRGAGLRAVAPDRFSTDHTPVVESFTVGGDLSVTGAVLDDSVSSKCSPPDGVLDDRETGLLTISIKNTGQTPLAATTATVTTAAPEISFPAGSTVSFPATPPFGSASASLAVGLSGARGVLDVVFAVSATDPGLAFPGAVMFSARHRVNVDDLRSSSTADDVESERPAWTAAGDDRLGRMGGAWRRIAVDEAGAIGHRFLGPDPGWPSDQWLVSPPLAVGTTGPLRIRLAHRHSFEADASTYFDGGVVEVSADGGASWTDLGPMADPGYGGMLNDQGRNPLRGRMAFVGASADYPAMQPLAFDLGSAYAGRTVGVRFRIGADDASGGPGWEIDDIAFEGITNQPFPQLTGDRGTCNRAPLAREDRYTTSEGETLRVEAPGVLANDSDPDGRPDVPLKAEIAGPPGSGIVTLEPGGSFTYVPHAGFSGTDSFAYRASDGTLASDTVAVVVTVTSISEPGGEHAAEQPPEAGNGDGGSDGDGDGSGPLAQPDAGAEGGSKQGGPGGGCDCGVGSPRRGLDGAMALAALAMALAAARRAPRVQGGQRQAGRARPTSR